MPASHNDCIRVRSSKPTIILTMKGSLRLIRVLGNIALYRIDLRRDGEETGITLKQCTHEDIPQVLPEARRMSDTVFAVVDNVEPSSTEGQMGVRKGDFVCDENYGMYKLADFETATLANSKLQCRLFLIRDLSKGSLPVDQRAGKRNEEVGTTKTKNQSFSKKKTKVSANNNDGDASSGEENHSRPSSTVSRKAAKLVYVEASPDQQGSQQKPRLPWEDCFEMLKEYTKIHGHANVNRKDPGPKGLKGFHLGRWVDRQRVRYRTKKLPREHIALLKSVGFAWNPGSGSKTPRFSSESAVIDKPTPSNRTVERESDVKSVQSRSSESLSSRKRSSTSDDDDEEERPSKRASLRRSVDATQEKNEPSLRSSRSRGSSQKFEGTDEALIWDRRFGELVEFSKHHGHIDVPFHPEKYFDLALWTVNQWAQYQSLSPDLRKKLNSVGISDEESIDDRNIRLWNEKFRMLEAYKAKHGHCDVPSQVIWGGIAIGKWVNNQRSNLKRRPFKGETKTRTKRLTDLGFTWYGSMPGMKA